jgi:hypothetical protein
MKNYLSIYLYGASIILAGVLLTISAFSSYKNIVLTLGITLTAGSLFAFIAAFSIERKQVQFAYHNLHALVMLVYGIFILTFCETMDKLLSATSYLFIFYAVSEIIFCSWIFNLRQKVVFKILLIRVALGLAIGIGTVVSIYFTTFQLESFGVLFIFIGINILLYVPIMKGKETRVMENVHHKAENLEGYPHYPASEDIYSQQIEEKDLDPEDIRRNKTPNETEGGNNEKNFKNHLSGDDLDIPGADLDDQEEKIGNEDEENNYYSLGGDNHTDLEENKD